MRVKPIAVPWVVETIYTQEMITQQPELLNLVGGLKPQSLDGASESDLEDFRSDQVRAPFDAAELTS